MKRFAALFIILFTLAYFSGTSFCLELLSDNSMSKISAQAHEDQGDPGLSPNIQFNHEATAVFSGTNERRSDHPIPAFPGASDDFNSPEKTILLDFLSIEREDAFGNTITEDFRAVAYEEDFVYENEDNGSFVIFDGTLNGIITIPDYWYDSETNTFITSKTININIDTLKEADRPSGNYVCSYQGNTYYNPAPTGNTEAEGATSFEIYHNRQSQTIGVAEDGDLSILIPVETEEGNFEWRVAAVIPEGERYIHIDLNPMTERRIINYDVKIANNIDGFNNPDIGQTSNTLGSLYANTAMNIESGSVIITIDE